jgi:putative intracellular protease/amidase
MDVYGPLKAIQFLSGRTQLNLYMLSHNLEPVTTEPVRSDMNPMKSSFWPTINPTHTFDNCPRLDVLIVPGGVGMRAPTLQPHVDFIAKRFPELQYLMTICTGVGLAAKAGVLEGRFATGTKGAWNTLLSMGPNVKWVAPARWVVDGKLWTSSGVRWLPPYYNPELLGVWGPLANKSARRRPASI